MAGPTTCSADIGIIVRLLGEVEQPQCFGNTHPAKVFFGFSKQVIHLSLFLNLAVDEQQDPYNFLQPGVYRVVCSEELEGLASQVRNESQF